MPNKDEIIEWLHEEIRFADEAKNENFKIAPNSFGAGYDFGRYAALCEVREKLGVKQ